MSGISHRIVEIRAGEGGEDARLFVAELAVAAEVPGARYGQFEVAASDGGSALVTDTASGQVYEVQLEQRPGAGAQPDLRVRARGLAQRHDVGAHRVRDMDAAHVRHQAGRVLEGDHRLQALQRGAAAVVDEHRHLRRGVRVAHRDPGREPVQLRLRQWIGTRLLNWVLCRKYKKGPVEQICFTRVGYFKLLHSLKQRRLCLRRRSVDFVGEDDVGKQRTLIELEKAFPGNMILFKNFGANDIGRHQVGGELNAAK